MKQKKLKGMKLSTTTKEVIGGVIALKLIDTIKK
jgi:hypothetical protein